MKSSAHSLVPTLKKREQFTTFTVNGECFGIEISKVQEVAGVPVLSHVPLAPPFVKGLVNLRGQIATAMGLREIFNLSKSEGSETMSVVCRIDGNLVALVVDQIGDVIEVDNSMFEQAPDTIVAGIRRYLKGVYKLNGRLLSIVEIDAIAKELLPPEESNSSRAL